MVSDAHLWDGQPLFQIWAPFDIGLAIIVAWVGAYTCLTIVSHLRYVQRLSLWYFAFLIMASAATALNAIWSMHFIGMEARKLSSVASAVVDDISSFIEVQHDSRLTAISALVPFLITTLGLHIMAAQENMKLDRRRLFYFFLCASFIASAICAMHYLGMESEVGNFSRTYSLWIVAASCVIALFAVCCALSLMFFLPNSIGVRLISSLLLAIAVNGMHHTGMLSATYTFNPVDDRDHAMRMPQAIIVAFVAVLIDFALITICHHYGDQLRWESESSRIQQEAKLQAMSKVLAMQAQGYSMAQSLIKALCDACVTLGPDMCICTTEKRLSIMLLRQDVTCISFVDLVHPQDREVFLNFMSSCNPKPVESDDPEPARALNLRLLDSMSNLVSVQVFHTCFQDSDDRVTHLLGVCEIGDRAVNEPAPPMIQPMQPPVCLSGALPGGDAESTGSSSHTASEDGANENNRIDNIFEAIVDDTPKVLRARAKSSSSGDPTQLNVTTESDKAFLLACQRGDGVSVWFNAIDFKILKCTAEFTLISGPAHVGKRITDWVAAPTELIAATQEFVNLVAYEASGFDDSPLHLVSEGQHVERTKKLSQQLRLCTPYSRRSRWEYMAQCLLTFPTSEELNIVGGEAVVVPVCASLSDIQRRPVVMHRTRAGSLGRPSVASTNSSHSDQASRSNMNASSPMKAHDVKQSMALPRRWGPSIDL